MAALTVSSVRGPERMKQALLNSCTLRGYRLTAIQSTSDTYTHHKGVEAFAVETPASLGDQVNVNIDSTRKVFTIESTGGGDSIVLWIWERD